MTKTPLRCYLDTIKVSAEVFAASEGLSPWSVRHWSRGNKLPALSSQIEIERATKGAVSPAMWLAWSLARQAKEAA